MPALLTQTLQTPLGAVLAGATPTGLCLIEFDDSPRAERQLARLARRLNATVQPGDMPLFAQLQSELDEYFAGNRRRFDLPLALAGTNFQRRVWLALLAIPYGETRSYGQLAAHLDHPHAARAVGAANGQNPLSILVPCHRLVDATGRLTGYGGGLWRKQRLLELEASGQAERLAALATQT